MKEETTDADSTTRDGDIIRLSLEDNDIAIHAIAGSSDTDMARSGAERSTEPEPRTLEILDDADEDGAVDHKRAAYA